MSLSPLVEI